MKKQHRVLSELYTAEGCESHQQAKAEVTVADPEPDETKKIPGNEARESNAPRDVWSTAVLA